MFPDILSVIISLPVFFHFISIFFVFYFPSSLFPPYFRLCFKAFFSCFFFLVFSSSFILLFLRDYCLFPVCYVSVYHFCFLSYFVRFSLVLPFRLSILDICYFLYCHVPSFCHIPLTRPVTVIIVSRLAPLSIASLYRRSNLNRVLSIKKRKKISFTLTLWIFCVSGFFYSHVTQSYKKNALKLRLRECVFVFFCFTEVENTVVSNCSFTQHHGQRS